MKSSKTLSLKMFTKPTHSPKVEVHIKEDTPISNNQTSSLDKDQSVMDQVKNKASDLADWTKQSNLFYSTSI